MQHNIGIERMFLLIAKLDTYKVDKSANDNFVARGEEVIFTITTVFPNFSENPDSVKNTYKIVDTSTDLKILGVETATVGGEKCSGGDNGLIYR